MCFFKSFFNTFKQFVAGTPYKSILQSYTSGIFSAGGLLIFLLGPAVVSFATQIYERRTLVIQNFKAVFTSIILGSLYGVYGTIGLCRLIGLGEGGLKMGMVGRQVTSPLALSMAKMLGLDSAGCRYVFRDVVEVDVVNVRVKRSNPVR